MVSKKAMIVLKHEFIQEVRSKSYIIFTLLGPVLLSLLFVIPAVISTVDPGEQRVLSIVDSTGKFTSYFENARASEPATSIEEEFTEAASSSKQEQAAMKALDADVTIKVVPVSTSIESLRDQVYAEALTGFLVIPANALADSGGRRATLRLRNTNDFSVIREVESIYAEALRNEKLKAKGVDPRILHDIDELADLETVKLSQGQESKDSGGTFIAGYLTGFLMYMGLLIYGAMILRSVAQEKSSRVIEVMVSSVRPYDLLLGKVLGISAAAVLQMTVWAVMMALLATVGVSMAENLSGSSLNINIPPSLFAYFVIYYILGFLIYATLYAAVGATADQESDAQQAAMPITFLVIIPILLMMGVIQSPSSTMSVVLSMIPFFSPILMMGRVFSETPPFWQIALSMALMIATFFGVLWVAARIYRTGILMYGKKFSPKEIIKWIRYS
ncbi:MAG TPA: ABC transporter permease [Candidatus Kapabacteria bacterium]|jgi:ABC-2 type transport system permease protein|nr:ABC transporter permease [Candidatus Kapabacteria bacterium]